jgi:hypothetical protein
MKKLFSLSLLPHSCLYTCPLSLSLSSSWLVAFIDPLIRELYRHQSRQSHAPARTHTNATGIHTCHHHPPANFCPSPVSSLLLLRRRRAVYLIFIVITSSIRYPDQKLKVGCVDIFWFNQLVAFWWLQNGSVSSLVCVWSGRTNFKTLCLIFKLSRASDERKK